MTMYLRKNRIVKCPECQGGVRVPIDIDTDDLPLACTCNLCGGNFDILGDGVFHKLDPSLYATAAYFTIDGMDKIEEKDNDDPNPQQKKMFHEKADKMGSITRELFDLSGELTYEIDQFKRTVAEHFMEEWKHANEFKDKWNTKWFSAFVDNPFCVLSRKCDDKFADQYSRIIFFPQFFAPNFGFEIASKGGMRIEVTTQYSRIGFPLDRLNASRIGVPASLDLYVIGNKILGSSLEFCWKDIPGIQEDADSNENWHSIYIKDSQKARVWLARHGIPAWGYRLIENSELRVPIVMPELRQAPFSKMWDVFQRSSRMLYISNYILPGMSFSKMLCSTFVGLKVFFVGNSKKKQLWSAAVCGVDNRSSGENFSDRVYITNNHLINKDVLLRSGLIVVDMTEELDLGILDDLYDYTGKLLIVTSDPFMDCFEENHIAAKVYGLVSTVYQDNSMLKTDIASGYSQSIRINNALRTLKGDMMQDGMTMLGKIFTD